MNRLDGKIALITGSGAETLKSEVLGIGGATVIEFCKEGATVIISDVFDKEGSEFASELKSKGYDVYYKHIDVTKNADWDNVISWIEKTFWKLDILVNNAGISMPINLFTTTEADWDKTNDVNSKGCFLGMKAASALMQKNNSGSIVNISSMYGLVGSPYSVGYHASKGAVRLMSKAAAIQLAPYKIRVNSVCPGMVMSPMQVRKKADISSERWEEFVGFLEDSPLNKAKKEWIPTSQIGLGIVYLASDEAQWVTGTDLVIDGGQTAQ